MPTPTRQETSSVHAEHGIRRHLILAFALIAAFLLPFLAGGIGNARATPLPFSPSRPQFAGLRAYYGELHDHTGYSRDGCGLPQTAVLRARERGNDFLALTDHHDCFTRPEIGSETRGCRIAQVDYHKWETLGALADQYTQDGSFVLLRGYEHTGTQGHINVFNSATAPYFEDPDAFYSWLAGQPPDVFAQFNHPLAFDWGGMGDFLGFLFFPPAAIKIRIQENSFARGFYVSYPKILERGWQTSSVGYADFHYADQVGQTRSYGIFAADITRANLIDALREGRTFGNTDGNLAVALLGNEQWMGSTTSADRITFRAYAADRSGDSIERMELLDASGVIASYQPMGNPAEHTFTVDHVQPGDFFYLHVVDSRGDHAWSGSIVRPLYPRLQANPATLAFSFTGSAAPAQERSFQLRANDGADLAWQASSEEGWLQVSPSQGLHLPAVLTVTASAGQLAPGLHTGSISLHTLDGSHTPLVVGVQAQLGSAGVPSIGIAPRTLDLVTSLDQPVILGSLAFSLSDASLSWSASSDVPWLAVSPGRGKGSDSIRLSADMSGYAPGRYTGQVVAMAGSQIRVAEVHLALQPRHPQSLTLQQDRDGYREVRDTYLDSYSRDKGHGSESSLQVRSGGQAVSLLQFKLPPLLTDTFVYTATLSLYAKGRTVQHNMILQVYEMLVPWDEATANWHRGASDSPWKAGGAAKKCADIACEPVLTIAADGAPRWYELDITPLVRRWVAHPEEVNRGLAITGDTEVNMAFLFHSSQSWVVEAALRPRLSIVYGEADVPATPTPTVAPTETPEPTATAPPTASATSEPSPTATPLPTATSTPTVTPSCTPTATPTATLAATPTPSPTPTRVILNLPVVLRA